MSMTNGPLGIMILGCVLAAGCGTTVPVVSRNMQCKVNPQLLEQRCDRPRMIAPDATYQSVVESMRADRQALLECGLRMDALQDSLVRCNQQAAQFNDRVDGINKHNSD